GYSDLLDRAARLRSRLWRGAFGARLLLPLLPLLTLGEEVQQVRAGALDDGAQLRQTLWIVDGGQHRHAGEARDILPLMGKFAHLWAGAPAAPRSTTPATMSVLVALALAAQSFGGIAPAPRAAWSALRPLRLLIAALLERLPSGVRDRVHL